MNKQIDWFEILIGLTIFAFVALPLATPLVAMIKDNNSSEQIKQLKQSNVELQQECEVYRNRCLELENILEGTGLVVDNCECR